MPLYEYECDDCGHRFEKIQKYSDAPIETCPVCGGHVRKLLSSPAIQFKGSGWYITDYARAGKSDGDKPAAGKTGEKTGEKTAEKSGEAAASTSSTDASSKSAESTSDAKSDTKTTKTENAAPAAKSK